MLQLSFFTAVGFSLPFLLGGCSSVEETRLQQSVSESITRQIQEFDSADAKSVVAARFEGGNHKFLAFVGEPQEPTVVPGLSQAEIQQLTDTKRYQWDVFYYYHGRSELGSAEEEQALRAARTHYAERVNREILEQLKQQKSAP